MSESGILQLATLLVGAAVTVLLAFIKREQSHIKHEQQIVREEAQKIKETLIVSTEQRNAKLDTIHDLVNSALGQEIKAKADAFRELAKYDPARWQEKANSAVKQYQELKEREKLAQKDPLDKLRDDVT